MPAKFFGQFLLERGAITSDMLLDAINYQRSINSPLCALAVENGYLSAEQLKRMDDEHMKSDRKFIEIAVREKILTFEQLTKLGEQKSEKWIFLGEALVQRGHLSLSKLQEMVEQYKKERMSAVDNLHIPLDGIREKEVITALLKVTVEIFVHYTRQIVKVVSVEELKAEPDDITYAFVQKVTGDKNFYYMLALPEALTISIASHILQQEVKQVDEIVMDAMSEFVNVVVGNGCAKLNMENWTVKPEPPQVMSKEMARKMKTSDAVTVKMRTTKGDFLLVFSFLADVKMSK